MISNSFAFADHKTKSKMNQAHNSYWDYLAPGWSIWEYMGMSEKSLLPCLNRIRSPILVVGAGQGQLVEALTIRSFKIVGLDGSMEMVAAAKQRRGLNLIPGLAESLPFIGNYFNTVILTTGVLDLMKPSTIDLILDEVRRITLPHALVIIGFFSPSEKIRYSASRLGYMAGWRQYQSRLWAIWFANRNPVRWANLVAHWTGCSAVEAALRVIRWKPVLEAIHADLERLAMAVHDQGYEPVKTLQSGLNFVLKGISRKRAIALLESYGIQRLTDYYEANVSTLTLTCKISRSGFKALR